MDSAEFPKGGYLDPWMMRNCPATLNLPVYITERMEEGRRVKVRIDLPAGLMVARVAFILCSHCSVTLDQ